MNRERWVQMQELFNRAVECEPDQRVQLLDEAGSTDPELRREVEALLSCHGSADGHLRAAVREQAGVIGLSLGNENGETAFVTSTLDASEPAPGGIIGSYHLMQRIGEGGMGEVWLAEQKQPVRRRVALKLIKAGMDTREVVKRFESERQALALMDHPAIAKVFDAGSTSQGRPYFVMEYVAGVPITAYCDKHKLTTRERLELFIHVCEGVQHAHQKAIIHRDLKPSNILVSEIDGKPMPRIIDFGVAKATSQPLTAETMFTRAGAVVGTPGYMSPEQADSGGEDIDTRTDVYSLGVVLYELLVGALPLDLNKLPFDEILRKLREQDAPKPSTKLRTLGPELTTTAQNRGTDPPTLARLLRGDVDAITLKALEKDRSRRYGSPSELGADIARHLRHEPVVARPASTVYRAGKYIRRHRIGVAVAAAAVLLLASFAVVQAFEIRRVTQERDRATRERDRADRITQFMTGMFKVSDPSEARGNKVTAREILDKASKDIDAGLSRDPELQAQMMDVMGTVYEGLGLYPQAESLLRRAVEIRSRVLGSEKPATLRSESELGLILFREGRLDESERLQKQTSDGLRRALGEQDPETLVSMNRLAVALSAQGRLPEAEKLFRRVLDSRRRTLSPEYPEVVSSLSNLASNLSEQKRFPEAEALTRQALESVRRRLGPDDPMTLTLETNLAFFLNGEGRFSEAEQLFRRSLPVQERVLGASHPQTLKSMNNLGEVLTNMGQYARAEEIFREVRDVQRRVLGPNHPEVAISIYNLASVALREGKYDVALSLLREAVDHGLYPRMSSDIQNDPDFQALHADPRFAALVAYARQRAAGSAAPH